MSGLPLRLACSLAFVLPTVLLAQASSSLARQDYSQIYAAPTATTLTADSPTAFDSGHRRRRAQSFLLPRIASNPRGTDARGTGSSPATLRLRGMEQRAAMPFLLSSSQPWQPVGPGQIATTQFGDVTGRVTSIAVAPWDASGNTVYLGATGGGVWRSTNAAALDSSTIQWQPLTDSLAAYSGVNITSLSIGAVSVQPGSGSDAAVLLAGTGDPNDVLDSYYGAGILRSADGGATWRLIRQSSDGFSGGITNYSFAGDAFSGFAWSTTNTNIVVAAVTDSFDGFINNINNSGTDNVAEAGLYYSTDAGQTWFLSTIEDGPNQVIQSSQTTVPSVFPGVPVSSVVWNPARRMFYAAVEYHGYYQSQDGETWTRLANQPGAAFTAAHCPFSTQSNSCTIFRGVLAVQQATGDMFALTVDSNDVDQGLWQDGCNAGANGCANPVRFGVQIPDAALDDKSSAGTIPQGTYNLTLAAVPATSGTLLFAGTGDVFRCNLAAGCVWRNTTNSAGCMSAKVAPAQHALAFLAQPAGQTLPLLYFGNDGGIWRSIDGVNETGAVCASSDAAHYENLNSGLGSLAEVTGLANSATDADVLLAGFGTIGSAATADISQSAWPQFLIGEGGLTVIQPTNANAYATLGPGVEIAQCTHGLNCTPADFAGNPTIGPAQVGGDQSLLIAPFALDPADSANMIVGTCRVWRGPASGGSTWSVANAISPMFDGDQKPSCNGNALIRSLAAGGVNVQSTTGAENSGAEVIYAGMAGLLDGGGAKAGGHVFSTRAANLANGTTKWTDLALSPVANEQSYSGVFNPYRFDVSSLYVDPHDFTGQTVYATIQGFGVPHLYVSTDGGASWTNISKNLPDLPLNDVLVDPNDAGVVYVASDGGVFVTENVSNCMGSGGQCWNVLGTGLPLAPAVKLAATPADGGYLRVGTYGRGIWQLPLLSGIPQTTMKVAPASLAFGGQPVQTLSSRQIVTVTNSGSTGLAVSSIVIAGDFLETDTCSGRTIAPGSACQIQVRFSPSASGTRTGTLTISANVTGGQQTVSLTGTGTAPAAIVLLPNSVSFGNQQIATTSAAQQVTVSNTGSAAIALTSESITGPFAIQNNSCTASLPANTGCTLAIVFNPVQTGAASGVLTVVSGRGAESIAINGTGENQATDTLSTTSLGFPATTENTASAPQTITLNNTGGIALTGIQVQMIGDFAVVNACGVSLNAQSSCALTLQYTPHAAGPERGSMIVTDNLRSQTVALSGTGIAPPRDTLSATALVFPATLVGHGAPSQTVNLTNSGGSTLTQLNVIAVGIGFSESTTCGTALAAQASCVITVGFHPATAGNATGQVEVADQIHTQSISLSGSGQTPAEDNLSPLTLAFAAQGVGTASTPQVVTLSNNGQATLTGIRLLSGNPDFALTTTCGTSLPTGNFCIARVTFTPHATGAESGILTVADVNRTQQVQLNGTGILANVTLSPESLDFGATGIQTSSAAQTLTLTNGSSSTLSGVSIAASGPFTETDTCGASVPPGASCSLSLVFQPNATGPQDGTVTVTSAGTGAMAVPLSGVGIAFNLVPVSSTSASVSSGTTANYTLQLVPVSGSVGNATISCSNPPPDSTCTVTPALASLSEASYIQVAIATGVATASMQVRPAAFSGFLPWPLELLLALVPLALVRRRSKTFRPGLARLLTLLLLVATLAGITACGKGIGPLGAGAPNPLPTTPLTPAGSYTVTVTAADAGLGKSVSLTVQVQ